MSELLAASEANRLLEMFGTGNASLVCPFGNVCFDGFNYSIPTLESSDGVFRKLLKTLADIQYGRASDEKYKSWVDIIDRP